MISRPFALAGFSFVFGLLVLNYAGGATAVLLAAATGCLLIVLCAKSLPERATYIVAALGVVAACVSFEGKERFEYQSALNLEANSIKIKAVVTDIRTDTNGTYYTLDSVLIGSAQAEYKLRMLSHEKINIGDEIEFFGDVSSIGQNDEAHSYYKSKGIYLYCKADSAVKTVAVGKSPFAAAVFRVKTYISSSLESLVGGEEGKLAVSMLTGDKGTMSGTVSNSFKACGLSHTLAVSGLHMNIIVLALYRFLRAVSKSTKRVSALLCIPIAVGYAALSGFSVSALRACIMVSVMLSGKLISRKGDSLNSLGLAALIITLPNPYAVADWSFMLSFSATLGIVLFLPYIESVDLHICKRVKHKFLSAVFTSLSDAAVVSCVATLFTLPVMILFVGTFSLVFLPANLMSFFAVPVLMISAVVTVLMSLLPFGFFARVAAFVCRTVCRYMLWLVRFLADNEFATVKVDSSVMKLWLAAVLIAVALILFFVADRKRAYIFSAVLTACSLAVTSCAFAAVNMGSIKVTAVYAKDAACFIVSHGTSAVLIGCDGAEYVVSNVFDKLGVTDVELAVVHKRADKNNLCIDGLYDNFSHGQTVAAKDCNINKLPADTVKTDSFAYDFHGSEIRYECVDGYDRCVLESKWGSVLFVFGYDTPQFDVGRTDFLFTLAEPPVWINTEEYKAVIVSAGGNTAVNSDNVYSTYENSNLTLDFNRWEKYKINSF